MSGTFIEVIKHSEQKNELWQWDTGRQIKITPKENAIVDEVHFSNAYSKDALVVNPQVNEQGSIVADIPNILLWQVFPINVYVVMDFPNGKGTIYEEQLKINSRKKPSDYIYTETEVRNYEALEERIKTLEENGTGGGGGITKETDPTVPQWAKEPTKPSYTAGEVGALPSYTKIPDKTSDLENDSGFVTKDNIEEVEKKLTKLSEDIADLKENGTGSGLTTEMVTALDNMFKKCAFTGDVSTEYTAFKQAFGLEGGGEVEPDVPDVPEDVTLTSISATYTGGDVTVGTSLTDLTGITVTAHYSDGTSKNVSGYTLSGTIAEGSNTITVSYGGKTATFTVTGVAESSGGETTGVSNETTWTSGVAYEFEPIANEYPDKATGEIKAYNGWDRSPYLYCAGASTLRAVVKYQSAMFNGTGDNAFYDADKNYVTPVNTDGVINTNDFNFKILNNAEVGTYHDIPIPENATYFVVSAGNGLYTGNPSYTNNEPYVEYVPYE